MLDELALLVKLQDVDNELKEIEAEKGDLPEQIQKLKNEFEKFNSMITSKQEGKKDLGDRKKEQSSIVTLARDQLAKSQAVIFNVKTTREYDAISTEIEQSKKRISESEMKQLELMTDEEELEREIVELKEKLLSLQNDLDERQSEMDERLSATKDEELSLQHKREKLVHGIKRPVLSHYERIRQIRDGIGIIFMTDAACGYCFSKIPPQRQVEIKRMNDVILCEVCGCIIVSKQS